MIFKGICFAIALFTTLLFISNLVADIVSVFSWCNTIHSDEDLRNKKKDAESFARYRLVLALIMSIFWGIFIVL